MSSPLTFQNAFAGTSISWTADQDYVLVATAAIGIDATSGQAIAMVVAIVSNDKNDTWANMGNPTAGTSKVIRNPIAVCSTIPAEIPAVPIDKGTTIFVSFGIAGSAILYLETPA